MTKAVRTAGLLALALAAATGAASAEPYVRVGAGWDWSTDAEFHDSDCLSVLPLLYGCQTGIDGRELGAYGSFGSSPALLLGFGVRVAPSVRLEAEIGYRPGFAFDGEANFLRTPGEQPVDAPVSTFAALGFVYFDARPLASHPAIRPFVGFGAGASWNAIDPMYMAFPGLTRQPATTITPAGTTTALSVAVTAGAGIELSERLTLDLAWRLTDHGRVATDVGELIIQRGTTLILVEIDETESRMFSNGLTASLRVGF